MRLASILIILSVFCLIALGSCSPVLVRSSNKLNQLKHDLFLESEVFVNKLATDYDQVDRLPKTIFVFEVTVEDQRALTQSNFLISKLNNLQSVKEYFSNPDYAYASNYISYEGADDITSRLHGKLVEIKPDYQEFAMNFKDFLSLSPEEITGKETDFLIHKVALNLNDLSFLDLYLLKNFPKIAQDTSNNYLVCILFNFKQTRLLQQNLLTGQRNNKFVPKILQATTGTAAGENANENTNEGEDNETTNGGYGAVGIQLTPAGLSGILVAIFLFLILLTAVNNLTNIQTPVYFAKTPLNIGKEQG